MNHPLIIQGSLKLVAWLVSGKTWRQKAYQKELLVTGARREGTKTAYESSWRKWASWCHQKKICPTRGPLNSILDFLAELFEKGLEYSTICGYRSATSAYHEPINALQKSSIPRDK